MADMADAPVTPGSLRGAQMSLSASSPTGSAASAGPPLPPPLLSPGPSATSRISDSAGNMAGTKQAAWVSLDPRNRGGSEPRLDWYPKHVAEILEERWSRHERSVLLGEAFHGAEVLMGDALQQRTQNGHRDVRRVLVATPGEDVVFRCTLVQGLWRFADPHEDGRGVRDIRRVAPLRELVAAGSRVVNEVVHGGPVESCEQPILTIGEEEDVELAPLWEWCMRAGAKLEEAKHFGTGAWGEYSPENNTAIEQAYQGHCRTVEIAAGVAQYTVNFGPEPGFATQEDEKNSKRRLVRRRMVPRGEVQKLLGASGILGSITLH